MISRKSFLAPIAMEQKPKKNKRFDCENSYIYYLRKVSFFLETSFFVQQGSCNNRKKIAFSSDLFESRWNHGNTC